MSTLYLVGTPIGNLEDISPRAVAVLRASAVVAVEKWEDSMKLLRHFDIHPIQVFKFHDANARRMVPELLRVLTTSDVALVTSAGMPGVSDPGADLVASCHERGILVVPIPGPSAPTTAIAASGFRGDFLFVGFLPKKDGARKQLFTECADHAYVLVCFETPYRLLRSLTLLATLYPAARVFVGKEMTKKFERYLVATPQTIVDLLARDAQFRKGEFTLAIDFDGK